MSQPFIGPYYQGSKIIETDNSIIFESYHPQQCGKLALKLIKPNRASEDMINNECQLMTEIKSNKIMHAIDIFDAPPYRVIVMPLAEGDLYDYLQEKGRLTELVACHLIYQALEAISYLHHLGVWHRDIKLENFLLVDGSDNDPQIVLCDLGYAAHFKPGEKGKDFLGTPLYAAPEIYRKIPYTQAIDIWSLGVVAYILLSGMSPFPIEPYAQSISIMSGDYILEGLEWDLVSPNAKDLVSRMLCVNPDNRITADQALFHPWFSEFPINQKPSIVRQAERVVEVEEALQNTIGFEDDYDMLDPVQ